MKSLTEKLKFSFANKLPIILQTEVTECGLACLAMIAHFHGFQTDLLTLRRQFSISLKGSRLQDLINIGKKIYLLSRPLKLELKDLKLLKTPCILHWDLDHFVVLKKISGNKVIIHDPAIGIVKYSLAEVSDHFTGVAMELTPAVDFEKKKDRSRLYLSDLWQSVVGIKQQLFQILLVSLGIEVFEVIIPLFTQLVTDGVIVAKDLSLLYVLCIGFGLLMLIKATSNFARSWLIIYLSNMLNIQLVANLMSHLFKLPLDFFEKRHLGDITSRFNSISQIQEKLSVDFVIAIVDGFMILITLSMMLMYSKLLTLIVLLALALYIVFRALLYPSIKYQTQQSLIAAAKEQSTFMESIRAILPLKIFNKETLREGVWQNSYINKLNANISLSKLNIIYQYIMEIIFGIEQVLIIALGANFIMNNEDFSVGMLIAYLAYRQQFIIKAQNLIEKIQQYQMIKIHLERVADIALTLPERNINSSIINSKVGNGSVVVQNLSFRYSELDPYIFKNVSFKIQAGEVLGIIGPSGCGKTSLMKILLGLLTPTEGNVLVDDIEISKLGLHNYRSQIAAVMQDDNLLSGSIADNICFFDPDPNFELMIECAKLAAIHNDIINMPMSYQTLVGDMGTTLSGGQRQRVLLARALYSKPKILFLDEATSNLDFDNESFINTQVRQLGITCIVISHRKEILNFADQILSLEPIKV
jgi:ATP-binding cassette subfamily B protein RaxB